MEQHLENWLHASDEERGKLHSNWDVAGGEGRDIAEWVAALFQKECIYYVCDVTVEDKDGKWQILAHADQDYDLLKDKDINFIGFKVNIEKVAA